MEQKIDVTLPVLIDMATAEYEYASQDIMNKLGVSEFIAEIAMEKALSEMKSRRTQLYASAVYNSSMQEYKEANGGGSIEHKDD